MLRRSSRRRSVLAFTALISLVAATHAQDPNLAGGGGSEYGDSGGQGMGGYGGYGAEPRWEIDVEQSDGTNKSVSNRYYQLFSYQLGSLRPRKVFDSLEAAQGGPSFYMGGEGGGGSYYGGEMGGMGGMQGPGGGMGGMSGMGGGMMSGSAGMPGGVEMSAGLGGGGMKGGGGTAEREQLQIWAFDFSSDGPRDTIELMLDGQGYRRLTGKTIGSDFGKFSEAAADSKVMPAAEVELVSRIIRQQIWKAATIERFKENLADSEKLKQLEQELKLLLTEEYDTQLARQASEISHIETRIASLRTELERRQAAKSRVVEVQLGNIVLEAQGLLGR